MRQVAAEGGFAIDVATYPDVLVDRAYIKTHQSATYTNRFRVAGAKLTIDGSPQGFTAWRDQPYYKPVGNYAPGYSGYAAASAEQVMSAVQWAAENGLQIITHANGERASDLLIAAHRAAQARSPDAKALRPVLIHGQFLREDQLDSYKALGVMPSLFPMHTFYWGDWHLDHTVGPQAGMNISPTGWALRRGMIFSSHHDAPVAFPDSMRVLDATVTRRARGSGRIVGPDQRVDVITALKAMTIWPAYQHFEEKSKGSLEVGKLADFAILSKDPTAVRAHHPRRDQGHRDGQGRQDHLQARARCARRCLGSRHQPAAGGLWRSSWAGPRLHARRDVPIDRAHGDRPVKSLTCLHGAQRWLATASQSVVAMHRVLSSLDVIRRVAALLPRSSLVRQGLLRSRQSRQLDTGFRSRC